MIHFALEIFSVDKTFVFAFDTYDISWFSSGTHIRGSYNKYVDLSCLRMCSIVYIIASELRQMVSKTQWTKVDPRHGKSTYLL